MRTNIIFLNNLHSKKTSRYIYKLRRPLEAVHYFYPPLPYNRGGNIGEGRQNENLINIVNGEYSTPISPPTTFE